MVSFSCSEDLIDRNWLEFDYRLILLDEKNSFFVKTINWDFSAKDSGEDRLQVEGDERNWSTSLPQESYRIEVGKKWKWV